MATTPPLISLLLFVLSTAVSAQPTLSKPEQDAVYHILTSINPTLPWRTLFPDDPCSAPHGVVCDYSPDNTAIHVTELNFGFVSDYSPNPSCTSKSTFDPVSLSPLTHLRKLFFYKCFTGDSVSLSSLSLLPSLEELVFIENPALIGSLTASIGNLKSLRRLVITGTSVSGELPNEIGDLVNLEELSLSRNNFTGEIPKSIANLKKLKLLDLNHNQFRGDLPDSIGGLTEVFKLDFSYNRFSGKIPDNLKELQKLEFMDLSYNKFGNFGVPLLLSEMKTLKEVYLSGNLLGGHIPEIWNNLRGILGIGLSSTGLVGNIPASMGLFLSNACYIGLDNNGLTGPVPEEFGSMGSVLELNLENNQLTGRVPFSAHFAGRMGEKLRLQGNPQLCVDEGLRLSNLRGNLEKLQVCKEEGGFYSSGVVSVGGSFVLEASYLLVLFGLFVMLL